MGYIIMPALGLLYYAFTIWISVFYYPSRRLNPSPQSPIETKLLFGSLGVLFLGLAIGLLFGSQICRRLAIWVYAILIVLIGYQAFSNISDWILFAIVELISLLLVYSLVRAGKHSHFVE